MNDRKALDTLANNLLKRLSIFIKEIEHISKSGVSSMNDDCKIILAREFQLLLIHLVDRQAFSKGLQSNARRIISASILSRLNNKAFLLSDTRELHNRDEYYMSCTDLFPRTPRDPRAFIGKLMIKVNEQNEYLNQVDEMVVAKLIADLVISKKISKSDIQAINALKSYNE